MNSEVCNTYSLTNKMNRCFRSLDDNLSEMFYFILFRKHRLNTLMIFT